MSRSFDPYHKWLGIAPGVRPPPPHLLLGIAEFESDAEVVHTAVVRQSTYVRNFQAGEFGAIAAKLLEEIAAAETKHLEIVRQKRSPRTPVPAVRIQGAEIIATPRIDIEVPAARKRRRPRRRRGLPIAAIASMLIAIAAATSAYLVWKRSQTTQDQQFVPSTIPTANAKQNPIRPAEEKPANVPPSKIEPPSIPLNVARKDPEVPGWGTFFNPAGDVTWMFVTGKKRIRLNIPPGEHDLVAMSGLMNAPRILRSFTGDFAFGVSVTGELEPGEKSFSMNRPYVGAGILLWIDANNYFRFEIGKVRRGERVVDLKIRELFVNGQRQELRGAAFRNPNRLALKRIGQTIEYALGDERNLSKGEPFLIPAHDTLQVGILGVNVTEKELVVDFEEVDWK